MTSLQHDARLYVVLEVPSGKSPPNEPGAVMQMADFVEKLPSGKNRKKLLNMAVEIVDTPIKNGAFPWLCM